MTPQDKLFRTEFTFTLKPSNIGGLGLGVFAAQHIPAGALLFYNQSAFRILKNSEVPEEFKKYGIFLNDEEGIYPEAFDRMEVGWFINHSDTPNMTNKAPEAGKDLVTDLAARGIYALRDIESGEEVTMDYNNLGEPEHLKEGYYKK